MKERKLSKMKLCLLVVACLLATARASNDNGRVDKIEFGTVTREIDVSSNLAKEKTTILVENKDTKSISSFLYTVARGSSDKLAYIGGQVRDIGVLYLMRTSIVLMYKCLQLIHEHVENAV